MICADFESILENVEGCKPDNNKSYTNKYQKHGDCSLVTSLFVVMITAIQNRPIFLEEKMPSVNLWKRCWRKLVIVKNIMKTKFNKPLKMGEEDEDIFKNPDECHICRRNSPRKTKK